MKERRIGTFTLGVMLIVFGVLFVINIFSDKMSYSIIIRFWPIVLILLGIEVLVGLYSKEKTKFTYDKGSVAVIIFITIFTFTAAIAQWCVTKGVKYVDRYYEEYMSREEDYVDGKALFNKNDIITVSIDGNEKKIIKGKNRDKIIKALKEYDWNENIIRQTKRGDYNIALNFGDDGTILYLSEESKNAYLNYEDIYGNELDENTYNLIIKNIKEKIE